MQKTNQRRSGSGVDTAALKSLKVKTGICKRVMKELHSYEQVVDKEFAKTQNVKNSQACSFDIKRQEHVLQESYMMVPNCQKRLETALTTLEKAVKECGAMTSSEECKELLAATQLIAQVKPIFADLTN
ncbi:tubulin-folding cofactor A [Physcomitrium patens]|uniref:tubulin-folding cofactor A n=1 Tax=Physcomitrium patens TaxID=3218 RepID=UPI000D16BBCF|nr:tubulin-folding cofactor A-like [Physcomitrium patens]|eukprot:XP_024377006.1 tubulin-folding cofactor A-like [Physcomitrella patens]